MPSVDWRFPAYLFAALVIGAILTYVQMSAYNRELNRALHVARGEHLVLVSGKGRSFRGGAIVIAIVDTINREITWARAMTGATVFARFRDVPALIGPMASAVDRVEGKQFKAAVEMAMAQVKSIPTGPPAGPEASASETGAAASETTPTQPQTATPRTRDVAGRAGTPPRDATPRLVRKRVVPPTQ